MRGNKISSKQNCFLGEAPKAICEERGDSKKKEKQACGLGGWGWGVTLKNRND